MTTVKVILDKRAAKDGKAAPLKISICHERQTSLISLNVYVMPHQWDSVTEKVIDHPNQLQLNAFIGGRKVEVEKVLISLLDDEIISGMRAKDVKDYILAKIAPKVEKAEKPEEDPNTFIKWFDRFTGRKQGRTKEIYEATRSRLVAWLGEAGLAKVKFEDIKISWLESFNDFLAKTCKTNSRKALSCCASVCLMSLFIRVISERILEVTDVRWLSKSGGFQSRGNTLRGDRRACASRT